MFAEILWNVFNQFLNEALIDKYLVVVALSCGRLILKLAVRIQQFISEPTYMQTFLYVTFASEVITIFCYIKRTLFMTNSKSWACDYCLFHSIVKLKFEST